MAHFKDVIKDLMRTRLSLTRVGRLLAFSVVRLSFSPSPSPSLSIPTFLSMFFHGLVNVGRGYWSSSNSRAQVSGSEVAGVTRCPQPFSAACCYCYYFFWGGRLAHPFAAPSHQSGPLVFFFFFRQLQGQPVMVGPSVTGPLGTGCLYTVELTLWLGVMDLLLSLFDCRFGCSLDGRREKATMKTHVQMLVTVKQGAHGAVAQAIVIVPTVHSQASLVLWPVTYCNKKPIKLCKIHFILE